MSSLIAMFSLLVLLSTNCFAANAGIASVAKSNPEEIAARLSFPYADGWLGADDAYSVPFAPDKSLWLFGDTFVGDPDTMLRSKAKTMVRNSVGITDCLPSKKCTIEYYWRNREADKPRSFFDTGKDEQWYWPMDAYLYKGTLYVSLMMVSNRPGAGPNNTFGFQIDGTRWATITNPSASPDQWHVFIKDLTQRELWPGVSIVRDGDFLLLYTQKSQGDGKGYMIVLRVPLERIENPKESWQFLRNDQKWHTGLPRDNAQHVIEQAVSEMSVRYHPLIKKWVAITPGPEFPSKRIVARTADSPLGPWSAPQDIFEFPEMKPSDPSYDKDTFCYATKEHTEFDDSKMVLTYACNSFSIQKVTNNMGIYRPEVVVLDLPK